MAAKVFLDEDGHSFIAEALRHRGWQALTTAEAGRLGATDTEQMLWAAAGGYVFLTYNIRDFPRLHYEMAQRGESHAGLIVATQDDPRANFASRTSHPEHIRCIRFGWSTDVSESLDGRNVHGDSQFSLTLRRGLANCHLPI